MLTLLKNKQLKGMTFVEVVIAISIFTVGILTFTLLFVKGWQSNKNALEEGQASMAASTGVRKAVDVIRKSRQGDNGSYSIVSATSNDLKIYSDVDGDDDTERVHYYLENGNFKMGITNPDTQVPPNYASSDETVNIVAQYVDNNGQPLFSYYDESGNLLTGTINVNEIRMIKIYLRVDANPNLPPDPVVVQSFVTPRNLIRE